MKSGLAIAILAAMILFAATPRADAQCVGDCNGNGAVVVNELIIGVNIALDHAPISDCPSFDTNDSNTVTVNELILAVNNALRGCPATPTATSTEAAPPTETATEAATELPPPTSTTTASIAPSPTATDTIAPTETSTATVPTATQTEAGSATATATAVENATATETTTATATEPGADTPTVTATTAETATSAETATATATATIGVTNTTAPTETETPTATFTTTPTPTMGSAVCGNGFLEPGETCGNCAPDCTVGACTATETSLTFQVHFEGVLGASPTTATSLIGYRSTLLSIPGTGSVTSVRQRVTYPAPLPNVASANDLDYALRVVVGRNGGLANGLLYSVRFDTCQGAAAPTIDDFGCTVEGCAGAGGPIEGCSCSLVATP